MRRLAPCIDRGLDEVTEVQAELRQEVQKIQAVANTLDPASGSQEDRRDQFAKLQRRFSKQQNPVAQHMAKVMASFLGGLFVGAADDLPQDNLDLERWLRLPKSHERRIHGHRHAGIRIVLEGRRWCMLWTRTPHIPSRSPWRTCCRTGRPKHNPAKPRRCIAARSCARRVPRKNAQLCWRTWSGGIANHQAFSPLADRCL